MPEDEVARAQIKGLDDRIEDYMENVGEALSELPARVGELHGTVGALVEDQREVRRDIRELRKDIKDRFDRVDSDHQRTAALNRAAIERSFWDKLKDTLAVLIPIMVALIAAYATIQAAHVP